MLPSFEQLFGRQRKGGWYLFVLQQLLLPLKQSSVSISCDLSLPNFHRPSSDSVEITVCPRGAGNVHDPTAHPDPQGKGLLHRGWNCPAGIWATLELHFYRRTGCDFLVGVGSTCRGCPWLACPLGISCAFYVPAEDAHITCFFFASGLYVAVSYVAVSSPVPPCQVDFLLEVSYSNPQSEPRILAADHFLTAGRLLYVVCTGLGGHIENFRLRRIHSSVLCT